MIRKGDVVRSDNGPPLKVVAIFGEKARCLWIDQRGRIREQYAHVSALVSFAATLAPKTLWPETRDGDEAPKWIVKKEQGRLRRKSRKPRRTHKIRSNADWIMSAVDQVLSEIEAWRTGKLWGAPIIAKCAGVSERTIVRWAEFPDCPIVKTAGRYFVTRAALVEWMTAKKSA